MSNMQETAAIAWDINLARRMRGTGMSLDQIAAVFAMTADTVHCRIDETYRAHRLALVNKRRRQIAEAKAASEQEAREQAAKGPQPWELTSEEGRELGIRAITVRTITASHPVGKSARWQQVPVSLPYLSILYGEAR